MIKKLSRYKLSFRYNTITWRTDRRTELVKQYRDLHAMHDDARYKSSGSRICFKLALVISRTEIKLDRCVLYVKRQHSYEISYNIGYNKIS